MNMEKKNVISLHELDQLTQYCLNTMSLMDRLTGGVVKEGETTEEAENDLQYAAYLSHDLLKSLRKVKIASLMQERTLICVSGMQGAGKTTLMKYFYGLDNDYLNISLDRGEQIPIFITESRKLDHGAELYAIRITKDKDGEYRQVEDQMTPDAFREASKGADTTTLYLELRVPYQHTNNENTSFVLLPGFEKQKSYRESLVDFAVSSSDAAIFAFDGRLFSQQDNYQHLKELTERFGANIIYAITRSDSSSDENARVRENFLQEMEIPNEDQVVCTGTYADPAKNAAWIARLKNAIDTYGSSTMRSQENNLDYLLDEINDVRIRLARIENILEMEDEGELVSHENSRLLQQFDRALEKQTEIYRKNLTAYYNEGASKCLAKVSAALDEQNRHTLNSVRKRVLGTTKKDADEAEATVVGALYELKPGEKDGQLRRSFIPDQCRKKALGASLNSLENPENSSLQYLLTSEMRDGKKYLEESRQNLEVSKMVCSMIQKPDVRNGPITMVSNVSTRNVMSTIVEIATYYYSMSNYDGLANACGDLEYEPGDEKIAWENVAQNAKRTGEFALGAACMASGIKDAYHENGAGRIPRNEQPAEEAATDIPDDGIPEADEARNSSESFARFARSGADSFCESSAMKRLSVGIAAMTGVDVLGDAKINMIPQIAASFGVSLGVVATAAVGALAVGTAVAVSRDISRIQCADAARARMAIDNAYEKLQDEALRDYRDKMQQLRDRLEQNLCDLDPSNRKPQQIYNAKKQIYAARNLLDDLADRCREKKESFL